MLALWRQDPPYDIQGKYWKFSIKDAIWPEFRVGWAPAPAPEPTSADRHVLVTPNSSSAAVAGERGDPDLWQLLQQAIPS
jgi:hypothetical protein